MTCLEAQSKIMAYIDQNLEKDEKIDFLKHMKVCEDCREELNIYYTMIEGMRQLDGNRPMSKDFVLELDEKIDQEMKRNRNKKKMVRSSVLLVIAGIITVGIVTYVNFLNILYMDEQNKLKEEQGEYYYSSAFEGYLFDPYNELGSLNINVSKEEPKVSFYEKIRQKQLLK